MSESVEPLTPTGERPTDKLRREVATQVKTALAGGAVSPAPAPSAASSEQPRDEVAAVAGTLIGALRKSPLLAWLAGLALGGTGGGAAGTALAGTSAQQIEAVATQVRTVAEKLDALGAEVKASSAEAKIVALNGARGEEWRRAVDEWRRATDERLRDLERRRKE